MKGILLAFVFLIVLVFSGFAQYVNTDELMVVPGIEEPVGLKDYELIREQELSEYQSYLSQFRVPGAGGYIISRYGPRSGRMHYGTDIKMAKGDTVRAVQDGYLTRSGWGSGFGNIIIIQHDNNIETYYAHLSKFLRTKGEWVKKGEPIALAGSTGRARGPHLHFEMHEEGRAFDPELVYDFSQQQVRPIAQNFETLIALHRTLKPQGYSTNLAVPEYYKVRSGDSLWVISRRYKTPIQEICRLNKISENTVLQIGQPLKMY
ncbi:peptidoglycan DD-metalloendopeptidase family protein [Maribellus sediminis]|uniref:peptidoglycan DD-metalloendopeptidase family protein n=1 Tax=Maribellus sediminis TaxID=2696285 RepID=UPI001430FE63|nr:peptidoglycan DD-metalloendopeptidase family protein [Maribellus sediminis]